MKRGEAYAHSTEKRVFDLAAVTALAPALAAASRVLARSTGQPLNEIMLLQDRIGGNGDMPFPLAKLRTLGPDGLPFNPLAARYRKLGIDELAQIHNICLGQMSVCGPRPLLPVTDGDFVGRDVVLDLADKKDGQAWDRMTKQRRPGIVSTYGLYEHTLPHETPLQDMVNQRVEMDLRDAAEDSLRTNRELLQQFAALAINRRLR